MSIDKDTLRPGQVVATYDRDVLPNNWQPDLSSGGAYYDDVGSNRIISSDILGENWVVDETLSTHILAYPYGGSPNDLRIIYYDLLSVMVEDPDAVPAPLWKPYVIPQCTCGAWSVGKHYPHMPECDVADEDLLDVRGQIGLKVRGPWA